MQPTPRLQQLENFLKEDPNDTFLLFAIAKEYENGGDLARALEFYLKLKNTDTHYVGLYYHLGKLYARQNETDLAIETYETGMRVSKAANDTHAFNELRGALDEII